MNNRRIEDHSITTKKINRIEEIQKFTADIVADFCISLMKGVEKMAGRPRKIIDISTGKIGKKEKLNRKFQEEKLKLGREDIENSTPEWLTEDAAKEFNRVVTEAQKIDLFDNLDLVILAIYADNYSRYIEATMKARQFGLTAQSRGAFTVSPYVEIADKAATQILKCSAKLGLATTDRLKLIVPTKEEKSVNKFLEFLK